MIIGPENISGSPEEIKDFMANNGLGAGDIFRIQKQVRWAPIVIAGVIYVGLDLALWGIKNPPRLLLGILLILAFLAVCFLVVALHLKYKNWVVSALCLAMLLAVLGLSLGLFGIKETIENLQRIPNIR